VRAVAVLAVDLDGTLLRADGSIHADDIAAIGRVRAAGVAVSIVTGRMYPGSIGAARAAGIEGPIACVDGSHIVDTRGDAAMYRRSFSGAHAGAIRDVLDHHAPASFVLGDHHIVHDSAGAVFASYVRTWSPHLVESARVAEHPMWDDEGAVLGVIALGDEARIASAAEDLADELGGAASVVQFPFRQIPGTYAMLVRVAGATKGTAIAWLAEHHGCGAANIVAVGDWHNDLPMFEVAGRSFAMAQAPDDVKSAATDLLEADGAVGGGVAEAIRRVWNV